MGINRITADLHLTTMDHHPERYNAYANILDQCLEKGIDVLILAGDVFDSSMHNYSDFESISSKKKYSKLNIHIIPGNHDPHISNKKIVGSNLSIHTEPHWENIGKGWSLLFIPYLNNRLMGDVIQRMMADKPSGKWILVGHGDFIQGVSRPDAYEKGVYMPLTQKDINQFQPDLVVLGHIHIQSHIGNLHYPGSPCALDITETGYRNFLIFETETCQIVTEQVETDRIMFDECLLIIPKVDQESFLKEQIENNIRSWGLDSGDEKKTTVRIKARGVSTDRENLIKHINKYFKKFTLYEDPDISEVSFVDDPERDYLVTQFLNSINQYDLPDGKDDPSTEDIILDALKMIYLER